MHAVMLVFAMSFLGEATTFALAYRDHNTCERDMPRVVAVAKSDPTVRSFTVTCSTLQHARDAL